MWNLVPLFKRNKAKDTFEYKMTARLCDEYLKSRKGEDKRLPPQEFLCKVVNQEYGIKGTCVKVLTF